MKMDHGSAAAFRCARNALAAFLCVAALVNAAEDYAADWDSCRYVYLNTNQTTGANVATNVRNFPVLIRLTAANWPAGANSSGNDIRFSKQNPSDTLAYEIESWNDQNSAAIWVLVDTVYGHGDGTHTGDSTVLKMWWKNASAAAGSNSGAVFRTADNFHAVWHLKETASTAADHYVDATNNGNHGTSASGHTPAQVNGVNGMAQDLEADEADYIFPPETMLNTGPSQLTLMVWYKPETVGAYVNKVLAKTWGGNPTAWQLGTRYDGSNNHSRFNLSTSSETDLTGNMNLSTGTWYLLTGTYDGSNMRVYVNDVRDNTVSKSGTVSGTGKPAIGVDGNRQVAAECADGVVDEARISTVARDSAWIVLCYKNQHPTSQSLVAFGPSAAVSPPANLTYSQNPAVYTQGVAITANSPSFTGGTPTSYSVSPPLPAGLNFSTNTGVISGTPSATAAQAGYTVTASNGGGSTNATVTITVNPPAPSGLAYAVASPEYTVGVAVAPDSLTVGNGAPVDSFTITPALGAGLQFNKANGAIYGTPSAAQVATPYTVTAHNAGGTGTVVVTITVVAAGAVTNPISLSGRIIDSAHVQLTITGYSALNTVDDDPLHCVDTIGVWYASSAFPTSPPNWASSSLLKYGLKTLKAAGTSYTTTASVLALYGASSYYYFIGSLRWHTALGDSTPPFGDPTTRGAQVLMFDTAAVKNPLVLNKLYFEAPDEVVIELSNTPGIVAPTESLGIWYGIVDTVDFTGGTGTVKWVPVSTVKASEPYVYRAQDSLFAGQAIEMYFAIALKDNQGRLSSVVLKGSVWVGIPLPENPIRLRADTVGAQGVRLSWSRKDTVRIWYGNAEVPIGANFNTTPFAELNPTSAESTLTIFTLNPQTLYWFGLQRFAGGFWSAVTDTSRVSITTLALGPGTAVPNRAALDSAWHDPLTNDIRVALHVDTAGLGLSDLQVGVAYGLSGFDALSVGLQVIELAGTDTSVAVKLMENLVYDTSYYIGLFLRRVGTPWAAPTDSSRAAVITSQYRWERVTYLSQGDTMTTAFNGNVILRWSVGQGNGVTDTIRAVSTDSLGTGFVAVGNVAIEFAEKLQTAPFRIGILFDTTRFDSSVRLYRDSAGVLLCAHGSWVSGDTVWLTTNNVLFPLFVLADTVRPVVTFAPEIDTGAVVPEGGAVGMGFTISDNTGNVRWALLYGRGHAGWESSIADTLDTLSQTFVKVIPANMSTSAYGLRAMLVVCDGGRCDSINVSRRVAAANTDETVTFSGRWTPLRVTGQLTDTTVDTCLKDLWAKTTGYDTRKFRLFRWYPHAGNASSPVKWVEYTDSMKGVFSFVPGRVCWVKTVVAQAVRFGPGASTSLKEAYSIALAPKTWTDIAVPFKFGVRLCDVFAATGPKADTLQYCRWLKTDSSYIARDLYALYLNDTTAGRDTLAYEPFNDAYCVYNPFDTVVTLSVPPNPLTMPPLAKSPSALARRRSSGGGWRVRVESRCGQALNTVEVGVVGEGGATTYYPQRPRFGALGVAVVNPADRRLYGHAFEHGSGGEGTAFELAFFNESTAARTVSARATPAGALPQGFSVGVFDPKQGAFVEDAASFAVSVDARSTDYRWVVSGTKDYIAHFVPNHAVYRLALLGAYPNPFRQTTALRFSLPSSDMAQVAFAVYDVQGRIVWRWSARDASRRGFCEIVWDGRDARGRKVAAGVYVLQMSAREKGSKKPVLFEHKLTRLP